MGFKTLTLGSLLTAGLNAYAQGPPNGPPGGPGGFPGAEPQQKSPEYTYMFQYPLPIPPMMSPTYTDTVNGVDIEYYELTLESFEKQIYPNLGKAKYTGYSTYLSEHLPIIV